MLDRVHVFLLVPAFKNTGPIKGVVAMANDLVRSVGVTVVALRRSDPFELNFEVVQIELRIAINCRFLGDLEGPR